MCPPVNKIALKLIAKQKCDLNEDHLLAEEWVTGEDMADVFRKAKEFQQKYRLAHITVDGYILPDPQPVPARPADYGQAPHRCDCAPGWPCQRCRS